MKKYIEDIYFDVAPVIAFSAYIILHWQNTLAEIIGMSVAGISFILWIISRLQLGKSFAVRVDAKKLVTSGIYSKVRNPMYVFSGLVVLGIIIALRNIYLYPLFLLLVIIQTKRIRKEEKTLSEKFGPAYIEYRKKTWF